MSQFDKNFTGRDNFVLTIGKLLQTAREEQGLTIADIAARLRLSEQYVKDLENEDYSHIGPRIYARGFILNYAKLLGLPTEEVLTALQSSHLPDDNLLVPQVLESASSINIKFRPYGENKRNFSVWFGLIFIVLFVTLVIVWWEGQKKQAYTKITAATKTIDSSIQNSQSNLLGTQTGDKDNAVDSINSNQTNNQAVTENNATTSNNTSTLSSTNENAVNIKPQAQPSTSSAAESPVSPQVTTSASPQQFTGESTGSSNQISPQDDQSNSSTTSPQEPLSSQENLYTPSNNESDDNSLQSQSATSTNNQVSSSSSRSKKAKAKTKKKKKYRRYQGASSNSYRSTSSLQALPVPGEN